MPARTALYVVSALVVAALLLSSAIRGHSPQTASEWLAPIGPAVTMAAVGLWVFDRWAWRQLGVRWLVGRPVLHGTWHGELVSDWIDPETNEETAPDTEVFLVIRQHFWSISARLITNESKSSSLFAELTADSDGVCHLVYVYVNKPKAGVQHRSKSHYGAAVLTAPQNSGDGIEGEYFTDRKTKGDMRFQTHFPKLVESYAAALGLL